MKHDCVFAELFAAKQAAQFGGAVAVGGGLYVLGEWTKLNLQNRTW
jgi:hypothetical protein